MLEAYSIRRPDGEIVAVWAMSRADALDVYRLLYEMKD